MLKNVGRHSLVGMMMIEIGMLLLVVTINWERQNVTPKLIRL